ncbi:MAG TPA: Na+/H+ antiporter NhaA [Longimicrobium sp.]|nr:Na+/H+ antiporter NhaA [Longimicrobium sp.]
MALKPAAILPPPRPTPIERVLTPFHDFVRTASAGGLVLIASTIVALVWANSPWSGSYEHLWETELTVAIGARALTYSLHHWINDGLMAVFFFLVGLEIKREVLVGELASARRAALPAAAALGGMVVPAGLYALFNAGGEGAPGWGIPMATDIAFAIGVLALLGPRTPTALKVFLTALAIVDDIGAVVVIAIFYTARIEWSALMAGMAFLAALAVLNRMGARQPLTYALIGILVWAAFLQSGVHATVAGVLVAMTVPVRTRINTHDFLKRGRRLMDAFDDTGPEGTSKITNHRQQAIVQEMETACQHAQSPLQRIEDSLHPWVAFLIIPLFALANAGVKLEGDLLAAFTHPVTLGVIVGLGLGKPIGITLFAWLAVKLRMASLPRGVSWGSIHAVSWLGGIGFTMSLFISALAFPGGEMVAEAKIGTFTASVLAGIAGWAMLRRIRPPAHDVPD